MVKTWALKCLLCRATPAGLRETDHSDLVRLQEHLMNDHQVSREELMAAVRERMEGGYVWRLPDGRTWLEAKEVQEW